jgi:hypothetical protein
MSLIDRWIPIVLLGCPLLLCGGCGAQPPEGLVAADGVLYWDTGERVTGHQGIVRFHPFDPDHPLIETSGKSAEQVSAARVETDGSFVVQTSRNVEGRAHDFSGIQPGTYKVLFFDMPPNGVEEHIHPDYNHPVRTPLSVEIYKEGVNHLELTLERRLKGWDPTVAAVDRTQLDWHKPPKDAQPPDGNP